MEYVKNIGVVFGQRIQLWWDIPVIDSFELLKDIYSVPQNLFQNNLEELINLLELKEIVKNIGPSTFFRPKDEVRNCSLSFT